MFHGSRPKYTVPTETSRTVRITHALRWNEWDVIKMIAVLGR